MRLRGAGVLTIGLTLLGPTDLVQVQFSPATGQKLEQSDLQKLADDQFRAQVRNTRKLQQAQQLTKLQNGSFSSTINGHQVTPTLVTGTFRLS